MRLTMTTTPCSALCARSSEMPSQEVAQPSAQRAEAVWRLTSGAELVQSFRDGDSLTAMLPSVSAVYMWKLRLADESLVAHDPDGTIRRITRLANTPQGRSQQIQISHALVSVGIEICGAGLPDYKRQVLTRFLAQQKQNNRWMINYLRGLEQHLPALYVGETGDLPRRTRDHLAGLTDFGQAISKEPGLDWSDLNFYYADLGPPSNSDSPLRKAMEYITAVLTVSAFTQRPG